MRLCETIIKVSHCLIMTYTLTYASFLSSSIIRSFVLQKYKAATAFTVTVTVKTAQPSEETNHDRLNRRERKNVTSNDGFLRLCYHRLVEVTEEMIFDRSINNCPASIHPSVTIQAQHRYRRCADDLRKPSSSRHYQHLLLVG